MTGVAEPWLSPLAEMATNPFVAGWRSRLARRAHNAEVHRSTRCSASLPNVKASYELLLWLVR